MNAQTKPTTADICEQEIADLQRFPYTPTRRDAVVFLLRVKSQLIADDVVIDAKPHRPWVEQYAWLCAERSRMDAEQAGQS